jgi:hypothetical protein
MGKITCLLSPPLWAFELNVLRLLERSRRELAFLA